MNELIHVFSIIHIIHIFFVIFGYSVKEALNMWHAQTALH